MRTFTDVEGPIGLVGLEIDFLSAVPHPAHEGADALLFKARHATRTQGGRRFRRKKRPSENPCTQKLQDLTEDLATWLGKAFVESDHDELADFIASHDNTTLAKFDDDGGVPVVMTSSEDGHAHLLHLSGRAGSTTWGKSEGEDSGHDHPFMLTLDQAGGFSVEVGDSEGHSHVVDTVALNAAFAAAALSKLQPEDHMPTKTQKTDEHKATEDQLALARLFMGLNDSERLHLEGLDDLGKAAFVKLDTGGRTTAIAKAAEADEIVFTDSLGQDYRKSDDPRLVALAKSAQEERVAAQKAREDLDQERLEKTASEELESLPGTPAQKAAVWKALQAIPKEHREAAVKAVQAGNMAIAKGFASLGTGAVNDELELESNDAAGQLEAMAQKHAADNKVPLHKAYSEVTKTEDGRALYAEVQKATTNATVLQ